MTKKLVVAVFAVTALLGGVCAAVAYDFSGTLKQSTGQIVATDGWDNSGTTLFWGVTNLGGGLWEYYYRLDVTNKNISHMILETTKPISGITVTKGALSSDSPKDWTPDNGNPGMPAPYTLYGLKFTDTNKTLEAEFTVNRAPVWGDFYAKDGGGQNDAVIAYNAGFNGTGIGAAVDRDGACDEMFLAVPDGSEPVVPEASSLVLGAMGLLGSGGYMLRRRK